MQVYLKFTYLCSRKVIKGNYTKIMRKVYTESRIQKMRELEIGASVEFKILPLTDRQSIRNTAWILKKQEGKSFTVNYDYDNQVMRVTRIS